MVELACGLIVGVVDVGRLLCTDDWMTVSDRLQPIDTVSAHQSVASATALLQRNGERIAVGFVFCPNDERLRALAVRGISRGDETDTSVEITLPETPIYRP